MEFETEFQNGVHWMPRRHRSDAETADDGVRYGVEALVALTTESGAMQRTKQSRKRLV
jgi:hypothetical protein